MRGKGLVIECLDHSNYIISTTFQFRCNLAVEGSWTCHAARDQVALHMDQALEPLFYDFCTFAGVPWLQSNHHPCVSKSPPNMRRYKFNRNSSNKQHPRNPAISDGGSWGAYPDACSTSTKEIFGLQVLSWGDRICDLGGHWSRQFWVIFVGSSYKLYTVSKCINHQHARFCGFLQNKAMWNTMGNPEICCFRAALGQFPIRNASAICVDLFWAPSQIENKKQ